MIPPRSIDKATIETIRDYTERLGLAMEVKGLMNIQYAVQSGKVYVLEVNPRASRTVPFVSKTIGRPIAKMAAQIMVGKSLEDLDFMEQPKVPYYSFKEAVLPFQKFPECNVVLGPEMRSTGEVMGIDPDEGLAFAKSQAGANSPLPLEGGVFVSVNDHDKEDFLPVAQQLEEMGFKIFATMGTSQFLRKNGISSQQVYKVNEGQPNVVDYMINNSIQMVINTFKGEKSKYDEGAIRTNAVMRGIPLFTTAAAANAVARGITALKSGKPTTLPIQAYHELARAANLSK
jgi:carbamoyl-phosphate synthase large subunit